METSCILEYGLDVTQWRLHVSWKMVRMIRGGDFMYLGRWFGCYAVETSCILEDGLDDTRLRLHVSWKMVWMIRGGDFRYLGRWFG